LPRRSPRTGSACGADPSPTARARARSRRASRDWVVRADGQDVQACHVVRVIEQRRQVDNGKGREQCGGYRGEGQPPPETRRVPAIPTGYSLATGCSTLPHGIGPHPRPSAWSCGSYAKIPWMPGAIQGRVHPSGPHGNPVRTQAPPKAAGPVDCRLGGFFCLGDMPVQRQGSSGVG
jgi:hypothetical protein